jgi:predicted  nucleic acid-binding Zn-ribbon protein
MMSPLTSVDPTVADINRQINNLFAMAKAATDNDSIRSLQGTLWQMEKQKRDIEAIQIDLEEEAAQIAKLNAEIDRFEKWASEVRPQLLDSS